MTGGWAATNTLREKIALRIAPWLYVPYREDREEAFKDLAEVAYDSREAVWMSLSRLREQRDFNIRQGAYLNDQRRAAEARCARLQQALDAANATGVVCPECGSDDLPFWRGGESPSWECPCVGVIFDPNGEALAGPDAAACEHDWIWPANVVCAKCGISGGDTPADSQKDKT